MPKKQVKGVESQDVDVMKFGPCSKEHFSGAAHLHPRGLPCRKRHRGRLYAVQHLQAATDCLPSQMRIGA